MSSKPRLYVDACCFIEAVKHRREIPLSSDAAQAKARQDDCWFFRRLCDASKDGAVALVTSMLSIAECLHVEENPGPSQETRDLFVEFLTSGTVVELIEADIFVSERARDLRWSDGIRLSGADGLHVATALIEECSEFLTLDRKIAKQKFSDAMPKLKTIGINVLRPSQTAHLPNEYKADDLFPEGTKTEES
jgi:predicted nucleic acid-binding protein